MQYLDTAALRTPAWLIASKLARRFEASGIVGRVMARQNMVLADLLDSRRLQRMAEAEATTGSKTEIYSRAELLADIRRALWRELNGSKVLIDDALRRDLQRTHLLLLTSSLKVAKAAQPVNVFQNRVVEPTAYHLIYADVEALHRSITQALPRAGDAATRAHLQLMKELAETVYTDR
jgi:hypothetical protein